MSSVMTEDVDFKGHALNVPSKTSQTDRAAKLVKLNDGRATPSPMSAPLQSSGIPGRQPPRTEEIPDTGKTQVLNFCMMRLSNPFLIQIVLFLSYLLVDIMCETYEFVFITFGFIIVYYDSNSSSSCFYS